MRLLRSFFALVMTACALDESGLAGDSGAADALLDASSKDVTVNDAVQDDAPSDAIADVPADVPPMPCNPTNAFGGFTPLGGVNTNVYDAQPFLTSDELTIFFARDTNGGRLGLFYATRTATSQPFGKTVELSLSGNQSIDTSPWVDDKLGTLLFASTRNGDSHYHLYEASGNGQPDGWSNVTKLTVLDAFDPAADVHPWVAPATGEVWFASDRLGSLDLYVAADTNSAPVYYGALATTAVENHPLLTADALTIYFGRNDQQNKTHIWSATRASTSAFFVNAAQVTDFDSGSSNNMPGWLSGDGCRMYFTSDRSGGSGNGDIWLATRAP